ncbi:putative quinol monooxygenase [Actinocorallia sp. A-T 12471]|uniref:putative quinol monooxygenase n=1 Tax=Actinocorallia sp. A-T 12471 TaxID=3089813 RepID=UPI0029D122EB|nr:antibiotic biosynthesis monooxygenase [Actinocorallia sp. A-T 12471]MDX6743628.1 hypothetical protein [Actinocorallia sp. A-T 12471]
MVGIVVRFVCRDEASAEAFDGLVAETVAEIEKREAGTLVYVAHRVEGEPLARVFYELYADRAAFAVHEEQGHTRRFLAEREQYLASVDVTWVQAQGGKVGGVGAGSGERSGLRTVLLTLAPLCGVLLVAFGLGRERVEAAVVGGVGVLVVLGCAWLVLKGPRRG